MMKVITFDQFIEMCSSFGLHTYEGIAHKIGVSSRTVSRWKEKGTVPEKYLRKLKGLLPAREVHTHSHCILLLKAILDFPDAKEIVEEDMVFLIGVQEELPNPMTSQLIEILLAERKGVTDSKR